MKKDLWIIKPSRFQNIDPRMQDQFFNTVFFAIVLFGIASGISCLLSKSYFGATIISFATSMISILTVYINKKTGRKYQSNLELLVITFLSFVFSPLLFIMNGGIHSGVPSSFVVGISMILFLIPRKKAYFIAFFLIIYYFFIFAIYNYYSTFFLQKFTPNLLDPENLRYFSFVDISTSSFVAAFMIGFLIRKVVRLYDEEKKKVIESIEKLDKMSKRDALTHVYNRNFLFESLKDITEDQTCFPLSLILLDIDNYKKLNDTYGHLTGDTVLVSLTQTIQSIIKSPQFIARYGGEEFVVVLPNKNLKAAADIAESIRGIVENSLLAQELKEKVTISLGVAQYDKNMTSEGIINAADKKMYEAKTNGKNRVCF